MLKDLHGTVKHSSGVILNSPFLAKGFNKRVALLDIIPGHHWEKVVIDLVL